MLGPFASKRELALRAWEGCLGEPYRWGGDHPEEGFDCSGLVIEGLKACGLFPRDGDDSAAGLALKYPVAQSVRPGVLLFWGAPKIIHVEIVVAVLGSEVFTLGASGGGSATLTTAAAIASGAYVKLRPARPGWVKAVDPFWS
jgi:hypothetical protein